MKSRIKFTLLITLFGLMGSLAQAGFTSIHVFGDGLSNTATNSGAGSLYYGKRYSNGRVWVEVLAQMQGLPFDPVKNTHSYFGNVSGNLYAETVAYTPPADASNALVVIWVNNADFYDPVINDAPGSGAWVNLISVAANNHYKAITNLYAKGIRTLVMPNVVDIATVPFANVLTAKANYFHQQCVAYNVAFSNMLNRARAACPNLVIYSPDYYSLLTDLLAHPANYGVTNTLYNYGNGPVSIDAVTYFVSIKNQALPLNGQGNNFIFWDDTDPTAKVHYIMACSAQQLISPVQIGGLTQIDGSNRLDIVNMPLGVNGFLEGCTNLMTSWTVVTNFSGTAPAQSVLIAAPQLPFLLGGYSGDGSITFDGSSSTNKVSIYPVYYNSQFYRLRFSYNWVWP